MISLEGGFMGGGECSLVAQMVKNLPAMQETWVRSLGWEDLLDTGEGNGKPLQYSCLENPMNRMKRQKDKTLKDEFLRSVGA